jgi:hypothetical protein
MPIAHIAEPLLRTDRNDDTPVCREGGHAVVGLFQNQADRLFRLGVTGSRQRVERRGIGTDRRRPDTPASSYCHHFAVTVSRSRSVGASKTDGPPRLRFTLASP